MQRKRGNHGFVRMDIDVCDFISRSGRLTSVAQGLNTLGLLSDYLKMVRYGTVIFEV